MNLQGVSSFKSISRQQSYNTPKVSLSTINNQYVTPKKSSFMPNASPQIKLNPTIRRNVSVPLDENYAQKLKRIIHANQKTEEEAKILYDHIKDFNFFETFNDRNEDSYFDYEAFVRLCQAMRYEKHPAKKVIFKEGDPSNGKLYIVYSGEVSVVLKQPEPELFVTQAKSLKSEVSIDENQEKEVSVSSLNEILKDKKSSRRRSRRVLTSFTPAKALRRSNLIHPESGSLTSFRPHQKLPEKLSASSISVIKQSSEPHVDISMEIEGMESEKIAQEKPKEFKIKYGDVPIDLKRLNALSPRKKHPGDEERIARQKSLIMDEEEGPRRKGWTTIRRIIPFVARTMKGMEELKHDKMSLKDVIKQYGTVDEVVKKGGFFGERAVYEKNERQCTIVTNTECQFLVIYKRDFYYISRNYDKKRTKLLNFIFNFIPDIENIHTFVIVEEFLPLLKEKTHDKGSYIIQEGSPGDCFFMLYEGTCEIIKTLKIDEASSKKEFFASIEQLVRVRPVYSEELSVCTLEKGAFVGEEVILNESNVYHYSVRVTSASATILTVSKEMFSTRFTRLTQSHVKHMYHEKKKKNTNLINYLIKNKYPTMEISKENNSNKESFVLTGQITLKLKSRAEMKRRAKHGLFQALTEKGTDANILSQYTTSIPSYGELYTPTERERIIKRSKSPGARVSRMSMGSISGVDANQDEEVNIELLPRTRIISRKSTQMDTIVQHSSNNITPSISMLVPTQPSSHIRNKTQQNIYQDILKPLKIPKEEYLKPDMLFDQPVKYVSSARQTTHLLPYEEQSPRNSFRGKRPSEFMKEPKKKTIESIKETIASLSKMKTEGNPGFESESSNAKLTIDLNSELYKLDKRAQKILDLKRSKLIGRKSLFPTLEKTDKNGSPRSGMENLIENFKDKIQLKIRKSANSSRTGSPRAKDGPFLLIKTPTIESAQSGRTSRSKVTISKLPATAKGSRKSSMTSDLLGDYDMLQGLEAEEEKGFKPFPEGQFANIVMRMRPITECQTERRGKTTKRGYLTEQEVLDKAKNDSNTKLLRMKYKKTLKLRMKKLSEGNIRQGGNKVNEGGVVIDYQVNGMLQTFQGKGLQKVAKKKTTKSPRGFLSSRGV